LEKAGSSLLLSNLSLRIAFVGQPVLDLAIEPQIGSRSSLNITTLPQVLTFSNYSKSYR